jgi:hypothetical protein
MPYCSLENFLNDKAQKDKRYSHLSELLQQTCSLRFLFPGRMRPGVTLLVPTQEYLDETDKLLKSTPEGAVEAGNRIRALILGAAYHNAAEFETNEVITLDKVKIDVSKISGAKVELKNGAILEKNKDFVETPSKDRDGSTVLKLAVWNVTKGHPQITGSSGRKTKKISVAGKRRGGADETSKVDDVQNLLARLLLAHADDEDYLNEFIKKYDAHLIMAGENELYYALNSVGTEIPILNALMRLMKGESEMPQLVHKFFETHLIAQIDITGEIKAATSAKPTGQPQSLSYVDSEKMAQKIESFRENYLDAAITTSNYIAKMKEIARDFFDESLYSPLMDDWLKTEYAEGANNFLIYSRLCQYMGMAHKKIAKKSGAVPEFKKCAGIAYNFFSSLNKESVLLYLDFSGDVVTGGYMVVDDNDIDDAYDLVNSTALGFMRDAREANSRAGYEVVSEHDFRNGSDGIIDYNI